VVLISDRIVSVEEAREMLHDALYTPWVSEPTEPQLILSGSLVIGELVEDGNAFLAAAAPDLAHTVVVQAEQIAAVLALCDHIDQSAGLNFAVSTRAIRTLLEVKS
jgi:hypothetical protein